MQPEEEAPDQIDIATSVTIARPRSQNNPPYGGENHAPPPPFRLFVSVSLFSPSRSSLQLSLSRSPLPSRRHALAAYFARFELARLSVGPRLRWCKELSAACSRSQKSDPLALEDISHESARNDRSISLRISSIIESPLLSAIKFSQKNHVLIVVRSTEERDPREPQRGSSSRGLANLK